MLDFKTINYSLFALILSICGYFLLINKEEQVISVTVNDNNSTCGISWEPYLYVDENGEITFESRKFTLPNLIKHLHGHNSQSPIVVFTIYGSPDAKTEYLINLVSELNLHFPDTAVGWEIRTAT